MSCHNVDLWKGTRQQGNKSNTLNSLYNFINNYYYFIYLSALNGQPNDVPPPACPAAAGRRDGLARPR